MEFRIIKETKFLVFTRCIDSAGTIIYVVVGKKTGQTLGNIKYYKPFEKWCYFPFEDTLYDWQCMDDISTFQNNLDRGAIE